jgi:hypothetical protein
MGQRNPGVGFACTVIMRMHLEIKRVGRAEFPEMLTDVLLHIKDIDKHI